MDLKKQVGNKLRDIRNQLGLTQEYLAGKIGTDVAYISRIENGYKNITLETIEKLVNAMNEDISDVVELHVKEEILQKAELIKIIGEILPDLDNELLNSIYILLKPHLK